MDLNILKVLAVGIQNYHLNTTTKDKVFFYAGDECKSDQQIPVVIIRDLYGLKSNSLAWMNHSLDILGDFMVFKSTLADPDVWLKTVMASDGFKYYTYILVYVDDIIMFDKYPRKYMSMIEEKYTVKPVSISKTEVYFG